VNEKAILKYFYFLVFFLGIFFNATAQENPANRKAEDYYKRAVNALYENNSKGLIENCYNAMDANPTFVKPYVLLADYCMDHGRLSEAIEVYNKLLINIPNNFDGLMGRAKAEQGLEKFDEAQTDYEAASNLTEIAAQYHKAALDRLEKLKYIRYLVAHPVPYDPVNLGPNINSEVDEYFPTFTVDGETMYFTRKKIRGIKERNGISFTDVNEDIMMSKKVNGEWQPAEDIPGPINTPDNNEGAMTIAPDGTYLIFTRCIGGNCDLYISFYINDNWTRPVNMGEPVNTRFKETQPSISGDGRTIYFASNRDGSLGGLDIWSSTHDDEWNFSQPINLGPIINTKEDDQFPFIHPDNQTLYFISRGHKGLGANDIFYARRNEGGKWDSAVNIGYPINTSADEPGLVIDRLGEYAYFSSERDGGYGKLDLYRFLLPKNARPHPVTYLKAHITDIYTKQPLQGNLELIDLETGKPVLKTIANNHGDVEAVLPGGKDYMVNVSDSGYLFYSNNIPLKNYHDNNPYQYNIELRPLKAGEKISLRNVFFPPDGFGLDEKSKPELNKLVAFMKENPNVKLEISGHTDNSGKPAHNQELSEKRAKTLYDYLVNEGKVPAARLTYKGYGDTQPIAPNTTEKGKQENRRTEVKIIN